MAVIAVGCGPGQGGMLAGHMLLLVPAPAGDPFPRTFKNVAEARGLLSEITVTPYGAGARAIAEFARLRRPDRLLVAGPALVAAAATGDADSLIASTTPLARLAGEWLLFVASPRSGFHDFDALARQLLRDPASVEMAGRAAGSPDHILYGLTARGLGADARLLRYAAFADTAQVVGALLDGRIAVGIGGYRDLAPRLRSGTLRALAVSAPDRLPGVDAPTLMESGARHTYANWRGLLAPGALPDGTRARLLEVCQELGGSAAWRQACLRAGWTPMYLADDDFREWLRTEARRARDVLADLGVL
ncbi:C4-dicarboxylate ABC transporter substrate-binding protein [Acrocarpospora phusangensis]|uniref:C4-dicarboxylate ABC transporter substrate-binding protein n=1 Tax=Acrocarpospora phusangensis TaxID=1070424 RepID=A0A919UQK0_9ACTN|nr:tripartite tricarboxylate transporter substrate-binding protein [Acrocarpospora phusangensis]GIH26493.1 C4-dicarboxylate ABC transporter substrate-binding protein [Acrocarpospora phusangensis]